MSFNLIFRSLGILLVAATVAEVQADTFTVYFSGTMSVESFGSPLQTDSTSFAVINASGNTSFTSGFLNYDGNFGKSTGTTAGYFDLKNAGQNLEYFIDSNPYFGSNDTFYQQGNSVAVSGIAEAEIITNFPVTHAELASFFFLETYNPDGKTGTFVGAISGNFQPAPEPISTFLVAASLVTIVARRRRFKDVSRRPSSL